MSDEQYIQDEAASGRKFFTTLLNIADEDLNPYQYRLYGHYVRVAGEAGACYESVRTTAQITRMSPAMVIKTRGELTDMRYIQCVKSDEQNDTIAVTVVDRWAENIRRCSEKRSPHKHGVHHINTPLPEGVHSINTGVHQESQKKNYKKKNQIKEEEPTAPAAQDAPAITPGQSADSTNGSAAHSAVEASASVKEGVPPGRARTPRQLANDEANRLKITALETAWGVPASAPDIPLYLKVTNALCAGGVQSDEFGLYVKRLRGIARQGRWNLTLNALTTNGRISEYVAARNAYSAQQVEVATVKPIEYYEDEDL